MNKKTRLLLGALLAMALVMALLPAVALADEEDEYYYGGWGWCHRGDYGATTLSDRASLSRVASALGLTSARLSSRLRAGDTAAEIAAEKGVDVEKVVDAALARHKNLLQRQVEDGYITQARADTMLGLMAEETRTAFEEGFGTGYGFGGYGMGPGMMGGWGHMGGMMGVGRMGGFGWGW